jgi:hypothetical protein
MKQVPHRHLGMPGPIRVYTVAFAMALTVLFDLRRIAAVFYLIMDIATHWGILRHLRSRIDVKPGIVVTAIVLDVIVLIAFFGSKHPPTPPSSTCQPPRSSSTSEQNASSCGHKPTRRPHEHVDAQLGVDEQLQARGRSKLSSVGRYEKRGHGRRGDADVLVIGVR